MSIRIATDVGGTFTDLVAMIDGEVRTLKVDTTPPDFERGVITAIQQSGIKPSALDFFVHGSTVVINALTERKGVLTGLITTEGFRDVLEIGRGNTPDLYNIYYRKPPPFIPRRLRLGVTERVSHRGEVLTPLDEQALRGAVEELRAAGAEAIAICFLHAYANPVHEQKALELVQALWPGIDAIASHQVAREWREYERTSSTALSAYVLPPARRYIGQLQSELARIGHERAPFIMQSNGGIATAVAAKANPITLVESGPVSGILGAAAYGKAIGEANLIVLDIGGTTAKCSLIHEGETRITTEYWLERTSTSPGYPLKTPVVDIVEIGNGGGSIAWLDAAGALHVGPASAGSTPGPVAYGKGGTAPTTTDANLLTGRINPASFCGGERQPDLAAVEAAFAELGVAKGRTAIEMAHGVVRIANANMVNALKLVSINRGYDPRDFALVAIGGGGPLHAAALAAELGIPRVIVPPYAAVFSAWGMLMIDLRRDLIRTRILPLDASHLKTIIDALTELDIEGRAAFLAEGIAAERLSSEWHVDARYRGQEHTVKVRLGQGGSHLDYADLAEQFHRRHESEYTFRLDAAIEVVNLHAVIIGHVDKPSMAVKAEGPTPPPVGVRQVDFAEGGVHASAIHDRKALPAGAEIAGPAIIEEQATATLVPPGSIARIDRYGGIHLFMQADTGGKEA